MSPSNLLQRASKVIPGGVNSPVRAFGSVGGTPIFMHHAEGPYLFSHDQTRYIDYIGSWGPMILGHAHPEVIAAVRAAASNGLSFGTPTEQEIELAECVTRLIPSIEMLRCVSSGTEATMTAIRLARGFTGRTKIIKFEGCYHGHHDALLVKAGSGCLTFGTPSSAGVPPEVTQHTLTATFNHLEEVQQIFKTHGDEIAAIILEPVAGNMGCIPPRPGFLEGLRTLCDQHRSLLIFDEVMTGFRVARGGAQALYQIKPDLTTLGKIIGGGMPVGAVGGSRAIMEHLSPLGPVYQAGTLSGNPIAMAAGLATLRLIQAEGFYETLSATTTQFANALRDAANEAGIPLQVNHVTGMLSCFFTDRPVDSLSDVLQSDTKRFNTFFHAMLKKGIHLPPSAFEAWFISAAHSEKIIAETMTAIKSSFKE